MINFYSLSLTQLQGEIFYVSFDYISQHISHFTFTLMLSYVCTQLLCWILYIKTFFFFQWISIHFFFARWLKFIVVSFVLHTQRKLWVNERVIYDVLNCTFSTIRFAIFCDLLKRRVFFIEIFLHTQGIFIGTQIDFLFTFGIPFFLKDANWVTSDSLSSSLNIFMKFSNDNSVWEREKFFFLPKKQMWRIKSFITCSYVSPFGSNSSNAQHVNNNAWFTFLYIKCATSMYNTLASCR